VAGQVNKHGFGIRKNRFDEDFNNGTACPVPKILIGVEMSKGHPAFKGLLADMLAIHEAKAADYGGHGTPLNNLWQSRSLGIDPFVGTLLRMGDKWARICQLSQKEEGAVKEETITDTLMDLAAYALLAVIVRRELQQLAKVEENETQLMEK
jgi:hypothetical protein